MVDVTLIRPLNKDQDHSFWYQSISHIRLHRLSSIFSSRSTWTHRLATIHHVTDRRRQTTYAPPRGGRALYSPSGGLGRGRAPAEIVFGAFKPKIWPLVATILMIFPKMVTERHCQVVDGTTSFGGERLFQVVERQTHRWQNAVPARFGWI